MQEFFTFESGKYTLFGRMYLFWFQNWSIRLVTLYFYADQSKEKFQKNFEVKL